MDGGLTRRSFLGGILAATTAPAIIKVENAMRLWTPRRDLFSYIDNPLRTLKPGVLIRIDALDVFLRISDEWPDAAEMAIRLERIAA